MCMSGSLETNVTSLFENRCSNRDSDAAKPSVVTGRTGSLGDIDQLLESELHGALSLRDDDSSAAFPTPTGSPG